MKAMSAANESAITGEPSTATGRVMTALPTRFQAKNEETGCAALDGVQGLQCASSGR